MLTIFQPKFIGILSEYNIYDKHIPLVESLNNIIIQVLFAIGYLK